VTELKISYFLTLSPEIKSYARSVMWHFLPPVDLFDTVWISFEIMAPQRTLFPGAGDTMRVCKAPGNLRHCKQLTVNLSPFTSRRPTRGLEVYLHSCVNR